MNEDTFIANVRRFDLQFQDGEWSFTREKADGLGAPPRSSGGTSIRSGHGRDQSHAVIEAEREKREKRRRATMVPGAQELWGNKYVGRFKVDRLELRCKFLRSNPHLGWFGRLS
jgi:hypothetical protein